MLLIPMASYTKSWFSLICACFSFPFASDVFVVIKNHHLQLYRSTDFKAQNENSMNFGSSLTVLVLHFINFVICYLSIEVTKVWK